MTVLGAAPFVQNAYNDQYGLGFPGTQISSEAFHNNKVISYSTEELVFCGRGVVRVTTQDFTNNLISRNLPANTQPFTIKPPDPVSIVSELVGVVVRPYTVTQSFLDVDSVNKAGFGAKEVVPVLPFGTGQRIVVRQDAAIGDVEYGDPVYIAIDPANSFSLLIGEFSNAAAGDPSHTLLVPNAIWYLKRGTTTANDDVNVIQLV